MQPDDLTDSFEIALMPAALLNDDRQPEPIQVFVPFLVDFEEPELLDPARAEQPVEIPRRPHARLMPFGLFGSFVLHLLPLVVLLGWSSAPAEVTPPIPVQLVFEEPPPAPPAPAEKKLPARGPLASEDMGTLGAAPEPEPAAAPSETQIAAVMPPPPLPPEPPPPQPLPPKEPAAAPPPKPAPPARPQPKTAAVLAFHRAEPIPRAALRQGQVPGPGASRDEYLSYLVTLTRRHLDVLPMGLVGGRQGETVLAIVVLDDGTIARIAVSHSSGYPDIDERVERMVAAVGRFPPLPQWFQGPRMELNLRLRFPEALDHR